MRGGGKPNLVAARVVDKVITFEPGLAIDKVQPEDFVEETDVLDKQIDVVIASANGTVELQDAQPAIPAVETPAALTDRGQIWALGVKVYVACRT